jgi:hypothetical protein
MDLNAALYAHDELNTFHVNNHCSRLLQPEFPPPDARATAVTQYSTSATDFQRLQQRLLFVEEVQSKADMLEYDQVFDLVLIFDFS